MTSRAGSWGVRRPARSWFSVAVAVAVMAGLASSSAPAAHAEDDDLTAPLAQAPIGAIVQGVWHDTMLARDSDWYLTTDRGAHWRRVGAAQGLDSDADLTFLDSSRAVFVETGSEDDEDGNPVSNSTVWVLDHTTEAADVAAIALPGVDVITANSEVAITQRDGTATATALEGKAETVLQPEFSTDHSAWFELGSPQPLKVDRTYGSNPMVATRSSIDPVPLDGTSAGDAATSVPGDVLFAGYLPGGMEYLVLRRTSGASTFEFDYCTRASGAAASVCNVLKRGISSRDSQQAFLSKVGDFAQMQVGKYLYATELRRSPSGKLPATVKVTGVHADHFPDGTRTRFATLGWSQRPIVTDTTMWTGGVFVVGASGRATRISTGPTGPVVPAQLSLSPLRIAGVDERHGGTAWTRTLGDFSTEQVMSTRGRQAMVSVGRVALNTDTGLFLRDGGRQVAKLAPWRALSEMSGPYLLGRTSRTASRATLLAGTKRVAFGPHEYPMAVFGSTVAAVSKGAGGLIIDDVRGGTRSRVGFVGLDDFTHLDSAWLWGDTIVVGGVLRNGPVDTKTIRFTDFRNHTSWEQTFSDGARVVEVGDGAAVIETGEWESWQVVNLATHEIVPLAGANGRVIPALDGAGRVLYATDSELVVHQLPFAGHSAPRALWTFASSTFNAFAGESSPWRLSVDVTKAVGAGSLVINGTGALAGTSVTVPVAASADGSLRIAWDGRLEGGTVAPAGTYTWKLLGFDSLQDITGASDVEGSLTVTNRKVAFPQAAPVIDKRRPATDAVLTVNPGRHPSDATVGYQWYRGGVRIKDATAATYTVRAGDVGKKLSVRVTFSWSAHYLNTKRTSAATAKVVRTSLVKGTVTLGQASPQVGTPMTAQVQGWGPEPVGLKYRWYRVGPKNSLKLISGQATSAYTPTAADTGHRLKVVVTASKPGYWSASVASPPSSVVVAG